MQLKIDKSGFLQIMLILYNKDFYVCFCVFSYLPRNRKDCF